MLQGKLCGLCGNNNYDTSDDMTTLDKQLMSSSRLFVMDNLLPSSYCDASDYETQLGVRHEGRPCYSVHCFENILKTYFFRLAFDLLG